jgi:hypothetical protein
MTIESAVVKELIVDSGVHAVCADRIYPAVAPQDISKPYVVYERLSVDQVFTMGGASNLQTARFRFTCGGQKYAEVVAADAAVRAALTGAVTGDGSVNVIACFFEQPDDVYSMESNVYVRACYVDVQFMRGD